MVSFLFLLLLLLLRLLTLVERPSHKLVMSTQLRGKGLNAQDSGERVMLHVLTQRLAELSSLLVLDLEKVAHVYATEVVTDCFRLPLMETGSVLFDLVVGIPLTGDSVGGRLERVGVEVLTRSLTDEGSEADLGTGVADVALRLLGLFLLVDILLSARLRSCLVGLLTIGACLTLSGLALIS